MLLTQQEAVSPQKLAHCVPDKKKKTALGVQMRIHQLVVARLLGYEVTGRARSKCSTDGQGILKGQLREGRRSRQFSEL